MSDKLRESVSAVMDGEADDLELRRLLAAADQPDVRAAWRDFHIQRDGLAGADLQFADIDISKRVWAALAAEPSLARITAAGSEDARSEDQRSEQRPAAKMARATATARWWRPLTSVAVAASVAALVVVGVRGLDGTSPAAPAAGGVAEIQPATSGELLPVDHLTPGGAAAVTVSADDAVGLVPVDQAELELEAEAAQHSGAANSHR